ncbi:glycosyltransferase involved in cell wall biosynthesis [Bradyrhizobium sp. LB1.3]|jgi:glycosyltransferase involved in cell wall biosynthesis|uniref:glycosyltransferase family 4 protein n=1 Tax=unclassified Bradyrhizobium TaxID=2631580 RepID=UPI001FF98307|nr:MULTISPECIES: glycosyltransferase family 1 protein [unclassified Bradyrhizobium]MCK1335051.1 glycosyltransferase family 1 protein [Bradyrhizobium sp. 38]MCK1779118.1 glycosyltransferase family 1 protein [Bradyrhizobium sp. 132]
MRVLIATDAWHPQVNGVVRTLTSLAGAAKALDVEIDFVTPDGFRSWPLPTYPGLRIALPSGKEIARRIEKAAPEALHIATEGPIGWATRAYCRRNRLAFTTSYTTRFPEYVSVRTGIPAAVGYAVLRHFHDAAAMTMVATPSLRQELSERGFKRLGFWTRGVNTKLFHPDSPAKLDLPGPIFMTMGRVAVEKNLEAFLSLDLPGTKVVVGDGPQKAALEKKYPDVVFLGEKKGADLSAHLAAADVFVFPSLTDTFGVVQLEALACGTPVAAFPVTGPKDVIADHPIGAIDHDLRTACLRALTMSRQTCRHFALERSWENSARQFVGNLTSLQPSRALRASPVMARRPVRG